jgi:hypothetical protein
VLPEAYDVVDHAGAITANSVTEPSAHSRATREEKVWDWVWGRRVNYFLTVFASLFLVAFPLIEKWKPGRGPASPAEIIVPVIDLIGAFLPGFVKPWLEAFRNSPGRFLIGLILAGVLTYFGGWMQGRIRDLMRQIWRTPGAPAVKPAGFVYRLRSAGPYRASFYVLKHWTLPLVFAVVIFVILASALTASVNRVLFAAFDLAGQVCTPSPAPAQPVTGSMKAKFETSALCAPTGLLLEKNQSYRVTLVVTDPWEDGHKSGESDPEKARGIETGPDGFGYERMRPMMWLGLPIRRLVGSNWFATILRVGNKGFGELVPPFAKDRSGNGYTATFKARKSGELFVYVNDTVVGIPGYFDVFYKNNKGKADLTIELLKDE